MNREKRKRLSQGEEAVRCVPSVKRWGNRATGTASRATHPFVSRSVTLSNTRTHTVTHAGWESNEDPRERHARQEGASGALVDYLTIKTSERERERESM